MMSRLRPALSDLSPGDKPWDKHRNFAIEFRVTITVLSFKPIQIEFRNVLINRFWIDYAGEQFSKAETTNS
jgi:hypothetical protein